MANITSRQEAQNPLILRCHRIMDAFAKSNDERDFYLNRIEGFLIYVDLDKSQEELDILEAELEKHKEDYCMVPKLTFYETKKIMEGFIAEKVYDIDIKEKLLDIIQSKEARENFLEFVSDHHSEFEKWQQYYQERSRIRIIEWLRQNHFHFVFEEDLELDSNLLDKLKRSLFETKVGKDLVSARKVLITKAKTYYSVEALNPRPKRGRPPKQAVKAEAEQQTSADIFLNITPSIRSFLFIPEIMNASAVTFSAKFDEELDLLMPRRNTNPTHASEENDLATASFNQKMIALRSLSSKWVDDKGFDDDDEDDEDDDLKVKSKAKAKEKAKLPAKKAAVVQSKTSSKATNFKAIETNAAPKKPNEKSPPKKKTPTPSSKTALKTLSKVKPTKVVPTKAKAKVIAKPPKKPALRSLVKTKKKS
ncbi:MAG: hypothetical protein H0T62_14005 [Parachlamydiaceae bacterium]|nr:hypothetical protein [Parachlamydiaceae bacterium]